MLAAKYGIAEMVEKILQKFPVSIYDKDKLSSKNIVLVAVENRNLQVYKLLINKYPRKHVVFQKVDKKDNTALHYAAMYDQDHVKPWPVPGAALQMQWEIKWHEVTIIFFQTKYSLISFIISIRFMIFRLLNF